MTGTTTGGLRDAEGFVFDLMPYPAAGDYWEVRSAVQTPDSTLALYADTVVDSGATGLDVAMTVGGIVPGTYACSGSTRVVSSIHDHKRHPPEPLASSRSDAGGECSIVLEEIGDVGEMVRGTFEATLVDEMDDAGFGPTWTLTNGTFEFVLQPPR